jgi:hypothetical protein
VHVEDRDVEALAGLDPPERLEGRFGRARPGSPQLPRCVVTMRRLVALSSTTSTRLPRRAGCTPLRSRRAGAGASAAAAARIAKRNSLPTPTSLVTLIRPPISSVSRWLIASPRPVPP